MVTLLMNARGIAGSIAWELLLAEIGGLLLRLNSSGDTEGCQLHFGLPTA